MITIDLPYPHKRLWPNGPARSPHAKAREIQKHRQWAHMATLAETRDRFVPSAIKLAVYGKPTGPLPDKDNCIAAAKSFLDGIADGLAVNDRNFPAPTVEYGKAREGRFVLLLSPPLSVNDAAVDGVSLADVLNESGPQQRDNAATGLTTNAKELRDGS